jgi:hypothetical protein
VRHLNNTCHAARAGRAPTEAQALELNVIRLTHIGIVNHEMGVGVDCPGENH